MALASLKYYRARTGKTRAYRFIGLVRAADPTSTLVLRRQFSAQMTKRFRELKGAITAHLVGDNTLAPTPVANVKYEYHNAAQKLDAFMSWLRDQQDAGVLELVFRPAAGGTQPWTNVYIQSAYQKGMMQTRREMRAAGAQIPMFEGGVDESVAAFNQPFHIDRVGLLYTRTYNDLRGVTDAMDAQISRTLAAGMAEGRNPRQIAREINKRVDAVGLTRARLIARTEVVHTHNQAALNEMELSSTQIDENILVQWFTAQDSRVRPTHQDRHGRVYTRGEGQALIGEPNCRCALLPYITSIMGSPDKATGAARSVINAVLKKQRAAVVPGPTPTAPPVAPKPKKADVDKAYAKYRKERETWLASGKRRSTNSRYAQMLRAHDEWLAVVDDAAAVEANKMEMLEQMLVIDSKVQPSSSVIGTVRNKLREGVANWVPADLLADMEAAGYNITFANRKGRAFFRSSDKLCTLFKGDAYDVFGHEFSHAIDDFMSRVTPRGFSQAAYKPVRGGVGTGFKWQNNRYVTNAEGAELRGSFKSLTSGTKGKYTNGDGYFWEDNWIDNYEGRIYSRVGGDTGVEWWSMNCQRYCQYRNKVLSYGDDIAWLQKQVDDNPFAKHGGDPFGRDAKKFRVQSKALEQMKKEGAEAYAARQSSWGRVRKSYPKLADFIEHKFGDARFVTK